MDLKQRVKEDLFAMQDTAYRDFQARLMPTIDIERIIGVRTPALRAYAKNIAKQGFAEQFMEMLPHYYYEENNLHGYLAELLKDFDKALEAVDKFLPYVDNWATCDTMCPKVFAKNLPKLYEKIKQWVASGKTYTVRYGVGMLMGFYLDDAFDAAYPELVSKIPAGGDYYIDMMISWYFATALAKQEEAILPYFEKKVLEKSVRNKAIQKSVESKRITPQMKKYLRGLKVK
ncbi:MAG: DNA alkylation repair protein [Eubacteriaceae bacterium]|nr:DNA alkylation repair protein [Eubacteriaceae bacterium]